MDGWTDTRSWGWMEGRLDKIVIKESKLLMLLFCIVSGTSSPTTNPCQAAAFEDKVGEQKSISSS